MTIKEMRKAFGSKCKTGMFWWWMGDLHNISWPTLPAEGRSYYTYKMVSGCSYNWKSYWDMF